MKAVLNGLCTNSNAYEAHKSSQLHIVLSLELLMLLFPDNVVNIAIYRLLFGVSEKLLTQHNSGLVTKCKLLYVSIQS